MPNEITVQEFIKELRELMFISPEASNMPLTVAMDRMSDNIMKPRVHKPTYHDPRYRVEV